MSEKYVVAQLRVTRWGRCPEVILDRTSDLVEANQRLHFRRSYLGDQVTIFNELYGASGTSYAEVITDD